jgi:hypothetical protein
MFCTKHFTFNPNSAKHYPLFICCEKYIFDNTESDASTDSVLIILFHNIYIKACMLIHCIHAFVFWES